MILFKVITLTTLAAFASAGREDGSWRVIGRTGVTAMHMVVVSPETVLIIDKAELNPDAKLPGGKTAWSCEYNFKTNRFRPLRLNTDTFSTGGAFFGDGELVSSAGGRTDGRDDEDDYVGMRRFQPCTNDRCQIDEVNRRLFSKRWYNTMLTLADGRIMNIGGSTESVRVNSAKLNNPTYEIHSSDELRAPKQVRLPFLVDTLPYNLYPFVHVIPSGDWEGYLWVFANRSSIIYDAASEKVVRNLPLLDGPPRSYPLTGTATMLPLKLTNNYEAEVLVCGGVEEQDVDAEAVDSCGRMNLNAKDPKWGEVTFGGIGRIMPDVVHLADGTVLFVNGAGRGFAGYPLRRNDHTASDPILNPVIYDPEEGEWTQLNPSQIPRMFHSVATIIPDGTVLVAGSNPNLEFTAPGKSEPFPTEYRAEILTPPYLLRGDVANKRATLLAVNDESQFNDTPLRVYYDGSITLSFQLGEYGSLSAALIHPGFKTQSMSMSMRYVELRVSNIERTDNVYSAKVWMPPRPTLMPPGPHYVFLVNDGVPADNTVWVLLGVEGN